MIYKNVASQKIAFFAYDLNTNSPLVGWGSAMSGFLSKDGAAPAILTTFTPTEITGGLYYFSPTQTETNADLMCVAVYSQSGNVAVDPLILYTSTQTPDVNAVQIGGSTTAANNASSFFTTGYHATNSAIGAVAVVSGTTNSNIIQISGSGPAAYNFLNFFNGSGYSASGSVNRLVGKTAEGITYDSTFEALLGFAAGKASGATSGASAIYIRNYSDNKNVIFMTVDQYGNRSSGVIS